MSMQASLVMRAGFQRALRVAAARGWGHQSAGPRHGLRSMHASLPACQLGLDGGAWQNGQSHVSWPAWGSSPHSRSMHGPPCCRKQAEKVSELEPTCAKDPGSRTKLACVHHAHGHGLRRNQGHASGYDMPCVVQPRPQSSLGQAHMC